MTYFRIAIALAGGTGTIVSYHETRDPIFTGIVAIVGLAAFVAAYLAYRS